MEVNEWINRAFYYLLQLLLSVVQQNSEDSGKNGILLCWILYKHTVKKKSCFENGPGQTSKGIAGIEADTSK